MCIMTESLWHQVLEVLSSCTSNNLKITTINTHVKAIHYKAIKNSYAEADQEFLFDKVKVQVKLIPCLIKYHTIKIYGGSE